MGLNKKHGTLRAYVEIMARMELCWNGKTIFSSNDICTCFELVKTYKNRHVKMLVLP